MANTAELKAKIEANPTGFSITDDEILLYLEQGLDGSFQIETENAQTLFLADADRDWETCWIRFNFCF